MHCIMISFINWNDKLPVHITGLIICSCFTDEHKKMSYWSKLEPNF